jgi:hypothetical protein
VIKVTTAHANDDFSLDLGFDDSSVKRFDVRPYLDYEVFRELQDLNYFRQVHLGFGTILWPNGQDIGPETLYSEGVVISGNGGSDVLLGS